MIENIDIDIDIGSVIGFSKFTSMMLPAELAYGIYLPWVP